MQLFGIILFDKSLMPYVFRPISERINTPLCYKFGCQTQKNLALAGNRTQADCMAGDHSTTAPPMLGCLDDWLIGQIGSDDIYPCRLFL